MSDAADILTKHYQKTFELTYEIWKQRNKTFLVLVAVIGAGTLLTFRAAQLLALARERVKRSSCALQECRKYWDAGILRGLTQCQRVL